MSNPLNRRTFMTSGLAAVGGATLMAAKSLGAEKESVDTVEAAESKRLKGRIKQCITGWCFMKNGDKWTLPKLISVAKRLGCPGLELIDPEHWSLLKEQGLVCALTRSHTFVRGMNNPLHWKECHGKLGAAIEASAAAGFPNVITFTGFADTSGENKGSRVSAEEGLRNCVAGYKKIVGLAERKGVTLVLELLNTRDATPMKGHPGYQGDHVDYCMEIIRQVGSPNLKLLFDVYHIQVMDGDLIRRIRTLKDFIGHVQIAGNPGRGEIGAQQEINYTAVMKAFLEIGYEGYVAHEWIPTGDPVKGLEEAVSICDV